MKRSLIVLCTVLCVSVVCAVAWARMNAVVVGGGVPASGCTEVLGTEVMTTANALNVGASEENDLDGWTQSTYDVFDTTCTPPTGGGSYCLHGETTGSGDNAYIALPAMSAGTTYKLVLQNKHLGSGGNQGVYLARGISGERLRIGPVLTSANTTWAERTVYWIYNGAFDHMNLIERGDNTGGLYIDLLSIKPVTTHCLGSELIVDADAATTGANEADSTATWTSAGSGTLASDEDETEPDGSSYISFLASADSDRFYKDLNGLMTAGHTYFVSWYMKSNGGDQTACGIFNQTALSTSSDASFTGSTSDTGTTWTKMGFSFTYNNDMRYFGCIEVGANNNAHVHIDALSLKEIQ